MSSFKRRNSGLVKLARDFRVAHQTTDDAVFDFLHALDTPRSLTVWLLYENKEHDQLVDLGIEPKDYNDPFKFRDDYAATHFLAKSNFLQVSRNRKDEAFKKFFKFEELCSQTNSRFRNLSLDPQFNGSNVWLLNATIRKIEGILGDYSCEELVDEANWGPGVTTKLSGCHVSAVNKFHCENGITRNLYSLVSSWFNTAYPRWSEHLLSEFGDQRFDYQTGNKIVTVPKNSKIDRVIAVEPGINLWFQKAIGSMIRRRLSRRGVDLNSQVRNQQLAKRASRDDFLATVDFSSASDSISREVVRVLIPQRWLLLLEATRSTIGIHDKSVIQWEKFSSMGNGFTFELESLIFYAAGLAVCEFCGLSCEDVSVYGDDVILPSSCYEVFSSFSAFLGFIVNKEKSFSSSYFRESCGSHYFDGIDVKPIYLKERLQNVKSIYKLANGVRLLAHRRNCYYGCDHKFRSCWCHLLHGVPKPLRLCVSRAVGDSGFIVNFDEATPVLNRHGIEGYLTWALTDTAVMRDFEGTGLLLARLRLASTQEYGNNYALRGRTSTRITQVLVPQWYNMGGWL